MKLVTLACAAWMAAATPLLAQGQSYGVKGGVDIATQTTTGESGGPSLDARIGAVAGGFWTLPVHSWLDLQVEGLYAMKGARLTVSGVKSTLALDYFEIPVLARARSGSGHRRYYAAGGPSFAVRIRAKARTAFSGSTEEIDVADQIESLDIGVAAGGGVEFGRLIVDGRYTHGFTDIDKDTSSKTRNRAIAVTAGFRF